MICSTFVPENFCFSGSSQSIFIVSVIPLFFQARVFTMKLNIQMNLTTSRLLTSAMDKNAGKVDAHAQDADDTRRGHASAPSLTRQLAVQTTLVVLCSFQLSE